MRSSDSSVGATSSSMIIAASQRSGSTLLGRALELTGCCGRPREWLQNSDREERMRAYGLSPETPHAEVVRAIVRRETTSAGFFPLKIMWDTMEAFLTRVRLDDPALERVSEFERFRSFFPHPRFILITRKNKLKQAVSFVKSLQSGVWEQRGEKPEIDPSLYEFDFLAIREAIDKFEREESAWKAFFVGNGIPYLDIVYEDFVADYEGTLRSVFRFLELPMPLSFEREAMDLKVMSDGINHSWIGRYGEVSETCLGANRPDRSGLPRLELSSMQLPPAIEAGKRFRVQINVVNTGSQTISLKRANQKGVGWPLLRAFWRNRITGAEQADPARGYFWQDLPPCAQTSISTVLSAPPEAGAYTLVCRAEQMGEKAIPEEIAEPLEEAVTVCWSEAEERFRHYFPEVQSQIGGWKWVSWLGYVYMPIFPWMCHEKLGWLLVDTKDSHPGELWLHETTLGWFSTEPGLFPEILRRDPPERLVYEGPQGGVCRFRRVEGGDYFDVTPKFR